MKSVSHLITLKIFFTGVGVPDSPTARFQCLLGLNSGTISGTVAAADLL